MTEQDVMEKLKKDLKESRYIHSLGVMESAVKLAQKYGGDPQKARTAGLLHDCAKCFSKEKILQLAEQYHLEFDEITSKQIELAHGPLGAVIAKEEYQVEDKEIFDAIYYHTTGRADMSLLEKVIYLADYIEPNRDFPGVEELRRLAEIDLDQAIYKAMNNTITYVLSLNGLLHPLTLKGRNDILLKLQRRIS